MKIRDRKQSANYRYDMQWIVSANALHHFKMSVYQGVEVEK